ncbi:MAG: DUF1501 domain-containing protein [Verrucomicrobiales bacterium]
MFNDRPSPFLSRTANGFGLVAANWLVGREARRFPYREKDVHFTPRAKRVIHICALGGVSQVDTFDYKPELARHHGQDTRILTTIRSSRNRA